MEPGCEAERKAIAKAENILLLQWLFPVWSVMVLIVR